MEEMEEIVFRDDDNTLKLIKKCLDQHDYYAH